MLVVRLGAGAYREVDWRVVVLRVVVCGLRNRVWGSEVRDGLKAGNVRG